VNPWVADEVAHLSRHQEIGCQNAVNPNYALKICESCCLDTPYVTSATEIPTVAE